MYILLITMSKIYISDLNKNLCSPVGYIELEMVIFKMTGGLHVSTNDDNIAKLIYRKLLLKLLNLAFGWSLFVWFSKR